MHLMHFFKKCEPESVSVCVTLDTDLEARVYFKWFIWEVIPENSNRGVGKGDRSPAGNCRATSLENVDSVEKISESLQLWDEEARAFTH